MRELGRLALGALCLLAPVASEAQEKVPSIIHFGLSGVFPSPLPVDDLILGIGAFDEVQKKFNIHIEPSTISAGPTAMAALLGGSIDFLVAAGNAFGRAVGQHQPVVGLMTLSQGYTGTMVAPTSLKSRGVGAAALAKWNGGSWGVASPGGIAELGAREAVEAAGLKWTDQRVIYTGSPAATAAGVAAQRLDIGQADNWTTARLVTDGQGFVVLDLSQLATDPTWNIQVNWLLIARRSTVARYPELTQAIVKAALKGLLKARSFEHDAKSALNAYPKSDAGSVPKPAFDEYWSLSSPSFSSVTGRFTPENLAATTKVLQRIGALRPGQTIPASAVDNSFVDAAYKSLGTTPTP